ncbi:hypothetical protein [Bacillus sp. AFS019443]|uniref:hypothetical protein n=1 Tax=Bacillus sp. AFS019443 TaxID=2034279 RepID=UPI000BF5F701|nr:hypothetical protein [Bacillus sp. AFS019443]PEU05838.1 hypothetical protein CN524_24765 [Bacillus sp. AFS019443]
MLPLHRSLNSFNKIELYDKYRYDFFNINWSSTLLGELVFVFRTNISKNDEDSGNIFIDTLEKDNIDAFEVTSHKNAFIHCVSDTDFEGNRKKINESIELVRYDNEISYEICVSFKNQRYYHSITKKQCELDEIQYSLFKVYDSEGVNNKSIEIDDIFMRQFNILRNKQAYEKSTNRDNINFKHSYEIQEALQVEMEAKRKYYYDRYRQAELEWSRLLLQFEYYPSKDMKILKYKPSL